MIGRFTACRLLPQFPQWGMKDCKNPVQVLPADDPTCEALTLSKAERR